MRKYIIILIFTCLHTLSGQIPNYVPSSGLVAWWPFTGNALDSSGNGNNGIINGPTLTSNRFGASNSAYSYNSSIYQEIKVNQNSKLNNTSEISISVWFNFTSNKDFNHLINKSNGLTSHQFVVSTNTKGIYFYYGDDPKYFQTTVLPQTGVWNHLVIVYSYNSTLKICKIFLNNIEIGNFITNNILSNTNYDLRIGSFGSNFFNTISGKIDDIGIWNRALDPCEIAGLYQAKVVSPKPSSVSIGSNTQSYCGKDSVKITATSGFKSYVWSNGKTGSSIYAKSTGTYTIAATDSQGCTVYDTAVISILNPKISPRDTVVCNYPNATLIATNSTSALARKLIYSATKTFTSNWNLNWTVTPKRKYLLRVSGIYGDGVWMGQSQFLDAAFDFRGSPIVAYNSCTLPISRWQFGDNCKIRPDNDIYNTNHIYDFTFLNDDGSVNINFSDPLLGDNSGTLTFELYELDNVKYLWINNDTTTTTKITQTGKSTVWVKVSNGIGSCYDTTTVRIQKPTVSMGKDTQSFCRVDSAQLTATPGFASYAWSNGKKGASVYANATGPISVTATDSFGCSATDNALISVQNPRILPRDTIVCSGQAVNLRLKGSAGMGVSYLWSTGDTKSTTRIQTAGTTQVWLKQFNGIGTCYDTTTVRISNPVLNVAADTLRFTNCKRDSLRLSVGKKWKSVQWSHGPKDSAVFLKTTGKYSVRVQDSVGCFTADTFNFINPGRVQASITRTDSVKCYNGSTGSAAGAATGGFAPLQFKWSNGQAGTTATGLQQGSYAFVATDAYGCADTVIASVKQPTRTVLSISKIDSITCYNFSNGRITTSGSGGTAPYQFRWQGGQTGNILSNLPSGVYRVYLTDKNGCKDSLNITLSNPPEVIARIVSGNMTLKGQNMNVAAQVTPAANYTYQWQPASVFGSNANKQNASIQLSNNTKLLLTATNAKGCVGKDSLEIGVVQPLKDIIPNAFSPNKDGLNEGFGLPDIFEIETFQVYDRWGGIIFKGSSSIPRWNGNAGNEPVPAGTYSYQITAKLKGGIQTVSYTGKVTVVK